MALRKSASIRSDNERHMEKPWLLQSKRTVEQQLLRSCRKEVVASNDFRDAHCGVINDRRDCVSCAVFVTGKREIAKCGRNIH